MVVFASFNCDKIKTEEKIWRISKIKLLRNLRFCANVYLLHVASHLKVLNFHLTLNILKFSPITIF